jgi:hypothetical protein
MQRTKKSNLYLVASFVCFCLSGLFFALAHMPLSRPSPPTGLTASVHKAAPSVPTQKRPVYGHSLVRGGVWTVADVRSNPLFAKLGFNVNLTRGFRMAQDECVKTAYLKDGRVFWTHQCVLVHKGELVFTDGTYYIRARCGNLIALRPDGPTEMVEVTDTELPVGEVPSTVDGTLPTVPQGVVAPVPVGTVPQAGGPPIPFPPVLIPTVPLTRVPDGDTVFVTVLGAAVMIGSILGAIL